MEQPKRQVRPMLLFYRTSPSSVNSYVLQVHQRRLHVLKRHLNRVATAKPRPGLVADFCSADSSKIEYKGGWQGIDPSEIDINDTENDLLPLVRGRILHFFDQIKDLRAIDGYDIGQHLPGPVRDDLGSNKRYGHIMEILRELQASHAGLMHA